MHLACIALYTLFIQIINNLTPPKRCGCQIVVFVFILFNTPDFYLFFYFYFLILLGGTVC